MLEEKYREYISALPLMTLRILGREKGVPPRLLGNKPELVEGLVEILMGKRPAVPRSGRGAPVKQNFLDPAVLVRLENIRREYEGKDILEESAYPEEIESFEDEVRISPARMTVRDSETVRSIFDQPVYTGILEIMQNGYGFLRAKNCQPTNGDVFIPAPLIHALKLREGDFVACSVKPREDTSAVRMRVKNDSAALDQVFTVNNLPVGKYEQRPFFDALTACYADEKIAFSKDESKLSLRVLDLFAPIGKGQRALIIAPPTAGKTTLLKDIARAIAEHHEEINLIVLLIDERPEEVTDIRQSVENAEVVYSTFDEGADHHVRAAELTIAHAKRMAEMGKDVVILLDSLTKLTRAYNYIAESTGKTLSGGLEAGALAEPKRFFGAARNTMEAGSITILATALVDTGSRMDDVIYEEFKGTGNSDIFLSRELAERRIFPAIDIRRSGTRKEEMLLSDAELNAVYKLRERGLTESVDGILDMLKKTENNEEFVSRLGEWLKVYKVK